MTMIEDHERWLARRQTGIGASEWAAALGLSRYDEQYGLWCLKTGRTEPKDENLSMWLGSAVEPIIAKRYEIETGRTLSDPGDYCVINHPLIPYLFCTPDRLAWSAEGGTSPQSVTMHTWPVELKFYFVRDEEEWQDNRLPIEIDCQVAAQMECMRSGFAEVAAILQNHSNNKRFVVVKREPNKDFIDWALGELHRFWRCVETDTPPEVGGLASTSKAVRSLHPMDNGETIELEGDGLKAYHRHEELKPVLQEIEAAKNQVIAALEKNTYGAINSERVVSYKARTRTHEDGTTSTSRALRFLK